MYNIDIHCVLHKTCRGAEKEWVDKDGKTPLLMATDYGQTKAVIKLLDKGAVLEATDYKDRNVVQFIVNHSYVKMLKVKIVMIGVKHCIYVGCNYFAMQSVLYIYIYIYIYIYTSITYFYASF